MKNTLLATSVAISLAVALSACDNHPQQVAYVPAQQVVAAPAPVVVQQPVVVQSSAADVAAAAMLGVAVGSMYSYGGHYYAHDYRGYYYMDHGRRYYDPRPPYSVTHHNYNVTNVTVNKTVAAAPQVVQPTKIVQPISARPQTGGINLVKAPAVVPAQTFRPVAARSFSSGSSSRSSFSPVSARRK